MMRKSDYINRYFDGNLTDEQIIEFNALLLNDTEFKAEFEFQKDLKDTLILNDRELTKKEVQNWDTEPRKNLFKAWQIAAGIIILLGLSWVWFLNQHNKSNEELYLTYFKPYRNVVQPIVRGESNTDLQTEAFTAYESKDFNKAIILFNELTNQNNNKIISFYKANALMQTNNTTDAIVILKENLKSSDTLTDKTLWYLALAYLKENNLDATKKTLNQLLSQSDFKSKEARILLEEIK